mgnify:CR=1 FL=1
MPAMGSKDQKDIIGIIFPVLPEHLHRFFERKKRVFVKFVAREDAHRSLQSGSKLFFYESRSNKEIVGEARIVDITSGMVEEVLAIYGEDLFLTRIELEEYAGDRKAKRMLVLVLGDVKKYAIPLRLDKSVTMAGQYMTKSMYDDLRAKQRTLTAHGV